MDMPDLPPGDLHWDGVTLTVGDTPVGPGVYRLPGTDAVLEVVEPDDGLVE